jgi:sugar/nucleoside kinase (ribokinase family)
MWQPPLVIVGGLYLDIYLSPVNAKDLRLGSEYGNLDTVRVECGGSAYFVGKYLFDRYRRRSHVFSRLGAGDALSGSLQALLKRERWPVDIEVTKVDKSQCGVSAHLLQHNGRHTTLTHKGALESLRWGQILPGLQRKTRRGGVLYISGYFRTGLHMDLCPTLQKLSPKLLICIDHGRFRKEESPTEAAALMGAFEQGLIDVYICTYPEIRELLASVGVEVNEATSQEEALKRFRSVGKLPPVTVVRADTEAPNSNAYVVFHDRVEVVQAGGGQATPNDHPGQKNKFNAGLVHALLTGSSNPHLPSIILDATRSALSA